MADLARLEQALRNADAAGDVDAAKVFAAEIRKMQSAPQQAQPEQSAANSFAMNAQAPTASGIMSGLQTVDDAVRGAANGATFGLADRLAGFMSGNGTEAERALSAQAQERSPVAYTGGEIAGAVAGLGKLQGMGATASTLVPAGMTGAKAMLAKMLAGGADSLVINEAMNAGYGRDFGENAGLAAGLGVAAPVAGQALSSLGSKALGMFNKPPQIMSGAALKQSGVDALEQANSQGVMFTPQAMEKLKTNVINDMTDFGYHPNNQPGVSAALDEINRLSGQNVTLKGLHTARKLTSGGFSPTNPSNNEAIDRIVSQIDDLISNPQAGDVVGNSGAASADFAKFKDLYARGSKLQKVESLIENARLQAGSTGSGGNVDNATRQKLRSLLTSPKAGRGFTADEKAAIEKVVVGTKPQNMLRLAGKLSPSGNGLMAALGVGGAMMNPAIGALSLGGMGAKAIADRTTQKGVEELTQLIAAGGKTSALQAPKNAAQKAIEAKKDLIAKLLMGGGLSMVPAN